jgi:hypothetical protein
LPTNLLSQTGHLLNKPTALLAPLGLTNSISKVAITATAVPVKNSWRIQLAFSWTPFSASQFATTKMLPATKISPISGTTMIFLIPSVMASSFQKKVTLYALQTYISP